VAHATKIAAFVVVMAAATMAAAFWSVSHTNAIYRNASRCDVKMFEYPRSLGYLSTTALPAGQVVPSPSTARLDRAEKLPI
jgi:hypothetical protein